MAIDVEFCKRYVISMRDQAKQVKRNRMDLNRDNYAMYQMEHNFEHKQPGQSREVLSKTRSATESSKSFFQQALADLDDWFRIEASDGTDGSAMPVTPAEMQKLLGYFLKRADYFSHVGASTQSGLLGSLAISRVGGKLICRPKFVARGSGKGTRYKKHVYASDEKTWELRFDNIRQEDYYPGDDLFRIDESIVDLHEVKKLSQGDDAIYDAEAVGRLKAWSGSDLQEEKKARETGQNATTSSMRPRVKLLNFYGTIVNEDGEILIENCVMTIANETEVIRKPTDNPKWHQKSDIVAAALIEFANSEWGIAMMDAGTKHNRSLIELFNLMLDSAMKSVWGIQQIRDDVLSDPTQIADGIRWGTALRTNASLPLGGKVMEEVITGHIQPEVMNMFNLLNQETLTAMKTNDLRMGAQSTRAVKATEVVAAENSITSEFQGIAKNFEEKKIQPELELSCAEICQNWDLIDQEVFTSLFGKDRGEVLKAMEPQDVFVATINGMKFEVFGISLTLRRQADFRKWTTLLQVIGSSEVLIEAFNQQGYSFGKLLGEIMSAVDINKSKIREGAEAAAPAQAAAPMEQPGGAPGATPDMQSQVPSPANTPQGGLASAFAGNAGQMSMPSSQAVS